MAHPQRQLKAMLRKNWLLKIRHPWVTFFEIMLPTIVMLMLIAVRTRVDTTLHPTQAYIRKGMFVEVGNSQISPSFEKLLKLSFVAGEHLAFAPDTVETRKMLKVLSLRFPLLKLVARIYRDELEVETYIRSREYGTHDFIRNVTYPKIKGAIIFHEQGPHFYDYSIRLNHSWAPSGFPDVKTIMDTNGPYQNDLQLGFSAIPTLQYGYSGFLTLQQVLDSFIIFASQWNGSLASQDRMDKEGSLNLHKTPSYFDINDLGMNQQMFGMRDENYDKNSVWTLFRPSNISIAPFPTRQYTDDEFQSIVKEVMGVLYLLGFLYPISRLISYSVVEKEQKIKEGLHMMGLKDYIFYLSWFITYAIQFAVSAAIITACTMNSIFQYSDKSVVFMYFFVFGLSAIMLSFLITTFFSRAKTAVAVGTLCFVGAYFPYYTVIDIAVPMAVKIAASLLSPTAFALGTVNFADYERAHVGVRWSNIWEASSGVNFLVCLLMMAFDAIAYCAIGLYLDKVLPQEYGIQHPWNFFCTLEFWKGKKRKLKFDWVNKHSHGSAMEWKTDYSSEVNQFFEPAIEPVSSDLKQQENDGRCIQIRNLRKVFKTPKGKCCAVNPFQLSLYEGQILSLLGHNGAGKSTTISMLVGLLPPTSGDALVFGKSILTNMEEIRRQLGVCPQYDILFPELTVKEHLEIFGILKGIEDDVLGNEVDQMLNEMDLCDKMNSNVRSLSGGMRRKLSLAIALIGNSKVVILDEPTSGMDPYSMRSTWQLIKRFKKGRVILLTTHSMDEADVLGDRIAIMGNGSLRCCGSSLFLKHRYGVGYTLTLVKQSQCASAAADIVSRHVPSAKLLTDVGSELSFRLPLSSVSSFEGLFREIESCICSTRNSIGSNNLNGEKYIGIESYGVSVTTLEEVFLRVAGCDCDENETYVGATDMNAKVEAVSELCCRSTDSKACTIKGYGSRSTKAAKRTLCAICSSFILIFSMFFSLLGLCRAQNHYLVSNRDSPSFLEHFKALIKKRAICARRDKRTIAFQLIVPALFLFLGLLLLKLRPHRDQISVTLTTSNFNPLLRSGGGGGPIPFNLSLTVAKKVAMHLKGGWVQKQEPRTYHFPDSEQVMADAIAVAGPQLGPSLLSMSEFLITSLNESYQSRYGAVVMTEPNVDGSLGYTVLHNSSCQHAAPTYINVMNNAILRLATQESNMSIQTRNHPLPMTESQHTQHHDLDAFSAAIIVNIAFAFIPSSFAVPIVKEREVKAKHQQIISGVSVLAYWVSTYVWDFISYLLPASLAMFLFYVFGLEQFIGRDSFGPTLFMLLGYGPAVAALTYCLTFLFTDYSVAQNVVLLVHFFSGLVLMVISFIMGLIRATKHTNSLLKNFFRVSPGFCLADGLASLALRRQGMKLGSGEGPLDWNVTGASVFYLLLESVIYFIFVLGFDLLPGPSICWASIRSWCTWLVGNKRYLLWPKGLTEPFIVSSVESHASNFEDEDEDVTAERVRVLSGAAKDSIIYLQNLRKIYPSSGNQPEKVAVDSLSFAVQEGECFGFLGTNGAGKSTTLSMLCGEEHPTGGTAYIFGKDILAHPKAAHQHVGYCPQFDALLELLTVREHLELYARIKGVSKEIFDQVVEGKLTEFDLWPQANKPSCSLSGGNKRKLSVAIAMIGDPPLVILDEPSTGMDPIAKRFMWDVISRISTRQGKTAVILTTHSMNEAQALCTRIGIMVGGRLCCLGSPQHLKTRFGNYLELEVKPVDVSVVELDNLCNTLQDMLFDFPSHSRGILSDLEICIGGSEAGSSTHMSETNLSHEMIIVAGRRLGNEEYVQNLISNSPCIDGVFSEQLSEQLFRDGGIPLRVFCEWWLAKEHVARINSFVFSSFPGATFQGRNGYSLSYQLPYREGASLADIFGHLEMNRVIAGIAEYSIGQSTLETIFNHFAANQ